MSKLLGQFVRVFIVIGIFHVLLSAQTAAPSKPIPIKVVVVAMFERGEDTGTRPVNTSSGSSVSTWIKSFLSRPGIIMCG